MGALHCSDAVWAFNHAESAFGNDLQLSSIECSLVGRIGFAVGALSISGALVTSVTPFSVGGRLQTVGETGTLAIASRDGILVRERLWH